MKARSSARPDRYTGWVFFDNRESMGLLRLALWLFNPLLSDPYLNMKHYPLHHPLHYNRWLHYYLLREKNEEKVKQERSGKPV